MSNIKHSVSIVGAGISGIMCALTLARSQTCKGWSINVYEQKSRVGGRAHTTFINDQFLDLGAGRFCSQIHVNVYDLVKSLNLEYETFPFTQLKTSQPIQKELKQLLDNLKPLIAEHRNDSFSDFLSTYLGPSKASDVIMALGYDSLSLPIISPSIAYDIIEKHPETQGFSENVGYQWFNLKEGFSALTQALYEQALLLGVNFHFDQELIAIEHSTDSHNLILEDQLGQRQTLSDGYKIVTLPPSRMQQLDGEFPKRWTNYSYGSSPLFKGFFFYTDSWWQGLGLTDHVVITRNPIRKLYFKDNKYVFFYTDGENALYWQDMYNQGEQHYLQAVRNFIADALHQSPESIPVAHSHIHKFWTHGVEFSKECCPEHPFYLTLGDDSVISLSDAYTHHCGWMEGGVLAGRHTAEAIISKQKATNHEPEKEVAYT
ncbi:MULTISPECIES: flavin monoamine oxidase family protein [Pseudoalteromonas]|uniref:VioA-tryptophan 2-monooxygenase n=1 Tax=Pseudoalteromonas amylolytica TaxID=1859457 RepID=A0A1S1MLR8_9GAMM|nr:MULTISPECIES: FAD-dependent oxidoreductase [Pseudoalteromonas]OHU86548.1 vioA - tryptophan 2-monooxygenase [Pseudoalteromonas sp. JW3]OHU88927.1 vioA - tryptophan 2-monooxygenase [Pseudoalteromonas amylolytica]